MSWWRITLLLNSSWLWLFSVAHYALAASAEGEGAERRGMMDLALDTTLWTIVVFLLLLFILRKYAWGPMLEGLQRREENIKAAIEDARRAREEAANLRAHLDEEKAKMGAQVRQAIDEAREDAQRLKEDFITQARAEIQIERDRLRREMEVARDQALQELWNQAAQVATLISTKAVHRQLSEEDHRVLVDDAIQELRQAGLKRNQQYKNLQ
ncbi:MAG: F0F1 ATP synthase subunit B [Gemmataceae bacterium]